MLTATFSIDFEFVFRDNALKRIVAYSAHTRMLLCFPTF
jgi:hypothetical protein